MKFILLFLILLFSFDILFVHTCQCFQNNSNPYTEPITGNGIGLFSFSFPLKRFTPDNAPISSVFDHSMSYPYFPNDSKVIAYTGEVGDKLFKEDCYSSNTGDIFIVNKYYVGARGYGGNKALCYDSHPGIDYAVKNEPVYPAANGIAHIPKSFPGIKDAQKFNTIEIDHGNGYKTYYLHCDRIYVSENESVDTNTPICLSGNKGEKNEPYHLHFEVHKNGIPVDPYGWSGNNSDPYTRAVNHRLWQYSTNTYRIRMSNVDDEAVLYLNDTKISVVKYKDDSGWIDGSSKMVTGVNKVRFVLNNKYQGWTYNFQIMRGEKVIWEESCGQVGVIGCNNNDYSEGTKYDKTIEIDDNGKIQAISNILPANQNTGNLNFNLSGKWKEINTKAIYNITQSRNDFKWVVENFRETATGRITDQNTVEARWNGVHGPGYAKGKIEEYDNTGSPMKITWSNRSVFVKIITP